MKKLIVLIVIYTLSSCYSGKNGISVSIINSSDQGIQNVEFSSDENSYIKFDNIPANGSVKEFLDMSENHKGDGTYILGFERIDGKRERKIGGYYTNGAALNSEALCIVKNDTIILKFQ